MEYQIRRIEQDELEAWGRQTSMTFGNEYRPEHLETRRQSFEFDRNIAAVQGDQLIGTAGIYSLRMVVPGGEVLPCAGVTMVTVRSSHRRKGVVTSLMRQQLQDVREKGEPLAGLYAAEASIYGRFGYGMASEAVEATIAREWARLSYGPMSVGQVRLVDADVAKRTWPAVHAAAIRDLPGGVERTEMWWDLRHFRDLPEWREGWTPNYYATYVEGDEAKGYVRYRMKMEWQHGLPAGKLLVVELTATTTTAYRGLWEYLFGIDLVAIVQIENVAIDEPLFWMLHDSRRLERHQTDALWLRIMDVPAALSARKYQVEGRVVFEVHDAFIPDIGGRFVLEGAPSGATCRPTTETPEITLGQEELGAAYLGGTPLRDFARAGRIEGVPDALRRADLMFGWHPKPFCTEHF